LTSAIACKKAGAEVHPNEAKAEVAKAAASAKEPKAKEPKATQPKAGCEKTAWTNGDAPKTAGRTLNGIAGLFDDGKGKAKSFHVTLFEPLCDWKGDAVSEIALVGEEGSDVARDLRKVIGRSVTLRTSEIYALPGHKVTATYAEGSVKKNDELRLAIAIPSDPNEGIAGCVGHDVVIVLPLHPGREDWRVTKIDKAFGKPLETTRERFLGATTPGQELRWSTAKMHGGTYSIELASDEDKVSVEVVLSCDD
jgi:hypothetical protein